MTIVPPGSGIVHQVNLEYLGRVVFNMDKVMYPDSVVGTDSHTTMINGLGIVGWGEFSYSLGIIFLIYYWQHILIELTYTCTMNRHSKHYRLSVELQYIMSHVLCKNWKWQRVYKRC